MTRVTDERIDELCEQRETIALNRESADELRALATEIRELREQKRGAEAEELRSGIETLIRAWDCVVPCSDLQDLLDEVDARDSLAHLELIARLASAEAANASTTATLVEHSELTGHIDIAKQCHDYLASEAQNAGDPSGKLRDFAESLRIVIEQLDKQRRSRNWYETAYTTSKQKLVESALSEQAARLSELERLKICDTCLEPAIRHVCRSHCHRE